jgi:hypothetical protein
MGINIMHWHGQQIVEIIQNKNCNETLKKMWALNNKIARHDTLSNEEKEFFRTHLEYIREYYSQMDSYWNDIGIPKDF